MHEKDTIMKQHQLQKAYAITSDQKKLPKNYDRTIAPAQRRIKIFVNKHYDRIYNYKTVLEETMAGMRTYSDKGEIKSIPLSKRDFDFLQLELRRTTLIFMLLDVFKDYEFKYSYDQTCNRDIGISREKLYRLTNNLNGSTHTFTHAEEMGIRRFYHANKKTHKISSQI